MIQMKEGAAYMRYKTGFSIQRRKKEMGKRAAGFMVFTAVIACFTLVAFAGDWVAREVLVPLFGIGEEKEAKNTVALESFEIYCAQIGMYTTQEKADIAAESARKRGGAGFVAEDGYYRVIASAYKTEDEALSVVEKLGEQGYAASVYTIKAEETACCICKDRKQREDLQERLSFFPWLCRRLAELSLSLDREEITQTRMLVELSGLKAQAVEAADAFPDIPDQPALTAAVKDALTLAEQTLGSAKESEDVKYACILMARVYAQLGGKIVS